MNSIKVNNITVLIPEKDSPCDTWKSYYDQLRKLFGKSNAKGIWLMTWSKRGAVSCTTNPAFNKWLHGIDINVSNAATKTLSDFNEMRSNIFGFGKTLTKVLAVGIPVTLMVVLFAIIFSLYKSSQNMEATDLLNSTPIGRTLNIAKQLKG